MMKKTMAIMSVAVMASIVGSQAAIIAQNTFDGADLAANNLTQDGRGSAAISSETLTWNVPNAGGSTGVNWDLGSYAGATNAVTVGNSFTISYDLSMDATVAGSKTHTILRLNDGNKFHDVNADIIFGEQAAATDPFTLNGSGSYTFGAEYHFDVVFNRTASVLNYGGGALAANSVAVFVDGTKAVDNFAMQGDQASWAADTISFVAFGGASTDATIDNLTLNTAAIPEPATLGLVGAMLGGMLFIRRRFML